jgi:hypothetical protein
LKVGVGDFVLELTYIIVTNTFETACGFASACLVARFVALAALYANLFGPAEGALLATAIRAGLAEFRQSLAGVRATAEEAGCAFIDTVFAFLGKRNALPFAAAEAVVTSHADRVLIDLVFTVLT